MIAMGDLNKKLKNVFFHLIKITIDEMTARE